MLNYKAIEIFTSEEARCRNRPVDDAVIRHVRDLKIAARCMVSRGIAGCYETGETVTGRLEVLSFNMPIRIHIILPAADAETVLTHLNNMEFDGIVVLHDLNVVSHRVSSALFPRQLLVRDVMTAEPQSISAGSPLSRAVKLLLSSIYTGLPVIDDQGRPIGVITQDDLITKGGMPLRLGQLAASEKDRMEAVLEKMATRRVADAMTTPPVTIASDRRLSEAVDLMLEKGVKRLPVVDDNGRLAGMLSRLDIFCTVMREAPDWKAFQAHAVEVDHLKRVKDILRRDTRTVSPDTPIEEVIRIIDQNDIQRVAVVDADGRLMGLISDHDLLFFFKQEQEGIWGLLSRVKQAFSPDANTGDLKNRLADTRAAAVMNTDLISVREETLIEEAIGIMTEKALKRLPVVDDARRFKGMISRDSLLRTGFGKPTSA